MFPNWLHRLANPTCQSFRKSRPDGRSRRRLLPLHLEVLEDRTLLSVTSAHPLLFNPDAPSPLGGSNLPVGLTPSQVRGAYGIDGIRFSLEGIVGDGSGQTIAIVDNCDNPKFVSSSDPAFNNSDLHLFDVK